MEGIGIIQSNPEVALVAPPSSFETGATTLPAGMSVSAAALARKRRKQIISSNRAATSAPSTAVVAVGSGEKEQYAKKRKVSDGDSPAEKDGETASVMEKKSDDSVVTDDNCINGGNGKSEYTNATSLYGKTTSNRGKADKSSRLTRYEPDVPMTKEEAEAWRKEARRLRNRESAAASRQKVRGRITELESQMKHWKSKYESIYNLDSAHAEIEVWKDKCDAVEEKLRLMEESQVETNHWKTKYEEVMDKLRCFEATEAEAVHWKTKYEAVMDNLRLAATTQAELEHWKTKHDTIMDKMREAESARAELECW
eukprot:CAMPEP_0195520706 /NCGR_PEP_ID=MMETSP0794_2-20130614/17461_1 /TAXON_ID=515487 /ORGANISM="Stephanopyxis turris, Strain CCMP 815" /LENGTH=311 /DNA_ID=CAMNT_0040650123 /DNA_START=9 /DNA_END=941 /DNA_ORIENTATION=+